MLQPPYYGGVTQQGLLMNFHYSIIIYRRTYWSVLITNVAYKYSQWQVETIGDAYMVVGGFPVFTTRHADVVISMAFEMVRASQSVYSPVNHLPLQVCLPICIIGLSLSLQVPACLSMRLSACHCFCLRVFLSFPLSDMHVYRLSTTEFESISTMLQKNAEIMPLLALSISR